MTAGKIGRWGRPAEHAAPEIEQSTRPLTELQHAFVRAHVENGGRNGAQAAKLAGYAGGPDTLKAQAWKLLHDPRIIQAIKDEADLKLRSGAALGASVLMEVASDPLHKDRLKAAQALLDRAGLLVTKEQKITVEHRDMSDAEKIKDVARMAKQLGLDPVQLLGQAGVHYVDAEFEEVAPALPSTEVVTR